MQAHQFSPAEKRGLSLTAHVLVWGGAILLLAGSVLAYPYVSSRLAVFPTSAPVFSRQQSTATSTVTLVTPTGIPTLTAKHSTPVVAIAATATATTPAAATSIPRPTPTPALPSRIVIPVIGVEAPVVPTSWDTAEVNGQTQVLWEVPDMHAAGWHETSAPLGLPGNTVLNGHNTANGEVFRDLYRLRPGDAIIVYSSNTPYTYAVSETLILLEAGQPFEIRRENARYIRPTADERLTLVTCHPYGSLRYRLIVIARPMAALETEEEYFPERGGKRDLPRP